MQQFSLSFFLFFTQEKEQRELMQYGRHVELSFSSAPCHVETGR
jgi:hypothetical protein